MELSKLTALQLADKIKKHEISVLDGVKEVFSQIEEKDGQIHAYLDTYKKEAYARAKEVQKGIDEGIYTGPLAGVPIAVKDNICVPGKPTTCAWQQGRPIWPLALIQAALSASQAPTAALPA